MLTIGVRLFVGVRVVDDAYITFRYARNISDGIGFVYNPGERVLGITTPLYCLLLSFVHLFVADVSTAAVLINTVMDAFTVILIYRICRLYLRHSFSAASIVALSFAFSMGSIRFTTGAMETGLFVFLLVFSVYLLLAASYLLSGVVIALTVLTRPEGVILYGVMVIVHVLKRRRIPWRALLISGVLLLPWIVFAIAYFGLPIPHSVVAKGGSYDFPALFAFKSLLGYLTSYLLPIGGWKVTRLWKYGLFALFLICCGLVTLESLAERLPTASVAICLLPATYLTAYTIANPPVWEWYAIPLVPFTLMTLSTGMIQGWSHLRERFSSSGVKWSTLSSVAGVFVCALLIVAGLAQMGYLRRFDPRRGRELAYEAVAGTLRGISDPGDVLAAPEIGTLGYFMPQTRILDTQGLVSPVALDYRDQLSSVRSGNGHRETWLLGSSIPPKLIHDRSPDFVVTLDYFASLLLASSRFKSEYRVVSTEPSSAFGSEAVLVFGRAE